MNQFKKETFFIKHLTLFFGIFLLCTDVFFLIFGMIYDLPAIRYLIYIKLVVNTINLFFDPEKALPGFNRDHLYGDPCDDDRGCDQSGNGIGVSALCIGDAYLRQLQLLSP
jgi:hypothetical protein